MFGAIELMMIDSIFKYFFLTTYQTDLFPLGMKSWTEIVVTELLEATEVNKRERIVLYK